MSLHRQPVSADRARERDAQAPLACGIDHPVLMERAALESLNFIRARGFSRVIILAGPGNNGGDALALARQCGDAGIACTCLSWTGTHRQSSLRHKQLASLAASAHPAVPVDGPGGILAHPGLQDADLVVDGLFGLGLRGPLDGEAADLVRGLAAGLKERGLPVLALDMPSGLFDGWCKDHPVLPARWTLCFDRIKAFLYSLACRPCCGSIHRAEIGIFLPDREDQVAFSLVHPAREPGLAAIPECLLYNDYDHKFLRGRVHVFAGSTSYPGAGLMTARGAIAGGAGVVYLHTEPELVLPSQFAEASLIVRGLPSQAGECTACLQGPGCLCAGPGWGDAPGRTELLGELLAAAEPLVLDAQALRLAADLEKDLRWPIRAPGANGVLPLVFTPHAGELACLAGVDAATVAQHTLEVLAKVARDYGAWVILKGATQYLVDPEGIICLVDQPVPSLAHAGSGDHFAGFLASQLAIARAWSVQNPSQSANREFWFTVIRYALVLWVRAGLAREDAGNIADSTALTSHIAVLRARDCGLSPGPGRVDGHDPSDLPAQGHDRMNCKKWKDRH